MDTNLHASSVHIWRCRVSKVQGMFLLRSSYQRSPENSYGPIHHAGARARNHGWGQIQPLQKIQQSLLAAHVASRTDQKPQEESPPVRQGSSTRVKSELAQNIWSPSIWSKIAVTHSRDSIKLWNVTRLIFMSSRFAVMNLIPAFNFVAFTSPILTFHLQWRLFAAKKRFP